MLDRDKFSWTTMISSFALHGQGKLAVRLFGRMVREGVEPDEISFTAVPKACSQGVLLNEGLEIFEPMQQLSITVV
ncbi:hypothetical protein AMTR_s00058p00196450 [Amborella trichopoda]|uniref:Pentatricopeptide repeat-containing protein n=1 Tax=Amborella trichopoda TaxID=13333 RepID=W1PG72_AMBTC|nr:hypothetical protein AMTR_s00058p00196450 [Amborella trichopoda]